MKSTIVNVADRAGFPDTCINPNLSVSKSWSVVFNFYFVPVRYTVIEEPL